MNVSIISVVPWQEAIKSKFIAAEFMERLYGRAGGVVVTRADLLDAPWPPCLP